MTTTKSSRLTTAQRRELETLRRRLDAHRAKETDILVAMGSVAADIYDEYPHFTKGLTAEIVDALKISRNHLYRLMDQAKLAELERSHDQEPTSP